MYKKGLLTFIFSFLLLHVFSQTPIYYNGKDFPNINKNFTWYADSSGTRSPDEIVKLKQNNNNFHNWSGGITFNKGVSSNIYWFSLIVKNTTTEYQNAVLKIASGIDSSWLYEIDSQNRPILLYSTSRYTAFERRPFQYRMTAFPLQLQPGESKALLLKADNRNRGIYFPLYISSSTQILKEESKRLWTYGLFIGAFLFIILFNLFLFLSMKDSIHLWYAGYVFSAILFMIQDEKFYTEIYPAAWLSFFENAWVPPFSLLMIAAGLRVMQLFVAQKRKNSKWYLPVSTMIIICFGISLMTLFLSFFSPASTLPILKKLYFLTDILVPISLVVGVISLIEKIAQKINLAAYYLVALLIMVLGSLNFYLNHLGITNFNYLRPNGIVVGLAFEIIILSLLLTLRYANLKKEKEIILKNQEQKIANQLIEAAVRSEEIERHRIAETLHDEVGALLSSSKLHIQGIKIESLDERDKQLHEKGKELLNEGIQKVRGISHNLHSSILKEFGLNEAIKHFINKLTHDAVMKLTVELDDRYSTQNQENDISIYRMVQELVNNILKHAHASELVISSVFQNHQLDITISYDGNGLSQKQFEELRYKKEGLGLKNIQNRVILLKGSIEFLAANSNKIIIHIPVTTVGI